MLPVAVRLPRAARRRRRRDPGRRRAGGDRRGRRARLRRRGGLRRGLRRDRGRRARSRTSWPRRRPRHELPVCGPNGNGIVALHERAALWGDALRAARAGPRGARLAERQRRRQRARHAARPAPAHGRLVRQLGRRSTRPTGSPRSPSEDEVGSIALYLEADGDGARLCEALAALRRARRRRRGAEGGRLRRRRRGGRGAHRRGGRRPARLPRAGRGGRRAPGPRTSTSCSSWPRRSPCRARARRAPAGSRCSPARAATRRSPPTSASGSGSPLPAARPRHRARGCASCCPTAATVGNPLDYTALIWGEVETLRDIVATTGADPRRRPACSSSTTSRPGSTARRTESWSAVREGILAGAAAQRGAGDASPPPCRSCSTTPPRPASPQAGIPAVAGLRTGLACVAALRRPAGRPGPAARDRARPPARRRPAATARRLARRARGQAAAARGPAAGRRGTARGATRTTPSPRWRELGGPVALKLSAPALRHKSELGALALDVARRATTCARPTARLAGLARRRGAACSSSAWPRRASSCSWRRARTASCPRS